MLRNRPLYGLIIALLPAAVAFAEVVRGTHSSSAWHPLGVIAFLWMLGAVEWYAWHEWHNSISGTGALAREASATTQEMGEGARLTKEPASLYALSLFMLTLLGIHPVFFALLAGGWALPLIFPGDPDMLYYAMSLGLWIAVYLILYKLPHAFDFNLRLNLKLADLGIGAFIAVVTFFVLRLYLVKLGHNHAPMHIFGVTKAADPAVFLAVGAIFTLINALTEELWFRGLLLGALRGLLPMWPAILLQALCFGLSHWVGTPQGILGLVLAGAWGIALGWWTYTRRSLWQALVVHLLADWLIFVYTNG
jgi:membrane protease YdiL (CAAX protease family)